LIHDNVFGTLEFKDFERKIINSPFLQRLTQIHQMGLAYYVYPGAVHNRFSHSLGVSHIAERIYRQLMKRESSRPKPQIERDVRTLKLSGLLHDIGHGPFSHVSDVAFKTLSHFKKSEIDSQVCSSSGDPASSKNIHEFVSFHVLNSKRFKEFIAEVYNKIDIDLDLVPLCITGNRFPFSDVNGLDTQSSLDKYDTLLIKIINGFSDADKIDYILRDSNYTGLPLPADIDRLISFFETIEVNDTYELGVSEKGARAFHLLLQSKAKMFPSVYQHHTTLACESLLEFGITNSILNWDEATKNLNKDVWPPIKCALDLMYYTDSSLLDYLRTINNPISNNVVRRLYQRKHYRTILQLFVWELKKKLIKLRRGKQFLESLQIENEEAYIDLLNLKNNGKIANYNIGLELEYKKYESTKQAKIDNFFDDFKDYPSIHEFKKKLIAKEKKYIFSKIPKELKSVDEEVLIDYIICVRIADPQPDKPYLQKYIKRINKFSNEEELLSLKNMGFSEPKVLDYQHITFYALPEFRDKLRPHLIQYVYDKLDIN